MSHYDFLSSLRLRDDRLKTDSKHFSDLKLRNFPLVKDLLTGTPTKQWIVQYRESN